MASRNFLVFDFGASNGRAVIARFDGERCTLEVVHRFDNRPVRAAGTLSWDILRLFSEIEIGIQKAARACPRIESIGIDTWGVDFGFVDGKARLLGSPVHYRDERRNAASREVMALLPARRLFDLTGLLVQSIVSLFNLYAMKVDDSPDLARARHFLMMPDLFGFLLTGRTVNEFTNATTTLAYSQMSSCWESRILEPLGIPLDLFHAPLAPGSMIGPLQQSVRRDLDVPAIPVIAPASHDTASAEAGVPAVAGTSWAFVSLGTWGVVGTETSAPLVTNEVFTSGFGNEGGAEGRNLLINNVTGLWIIQQCRERWAREDGGEMGWDQVVSLCREAPPQRSLIDVQDPAFAAPQLDMPQVVADACHRADQPVPSERGEIARCVYESLALKFRQLVDQLRGFTGRGIDVLHMVGGGAQNSALCQWTADATGLPVVAGPVETTVVGNLAMQLKAAGDVRSLEEARCIIGRSSETRCYQPADRSAWDDAYGRYQRAFP
jgi:sugar (pentulose or hexulose) kinase